MTLTLEEAILHCEEKSCGNSECSKEHSQLALWLRELKAIKDIRNGIIIDNVIYEAVDFNGKDYDGTSACASCDLLDVCASLYNKNSLCQTFVYESKLLSEYVIFRKRKEKWNC